MNTLKITKVSLVKLIVFILLFTSCDDSFDEEITISKITMKGKVISNKKEGLWRFYFENGNLYAIGNYINDKLNGNWRYFDKLGNMKTLEYYIDGKKYGNQYYYNLEGRIGSTEFFNNDTIKHMISYFYYRDRVKIILFKTEGIKKIKEYTINYDFVETFYPPSNIEVDIIESDPQRELKRKKNN